MSSPSLCGARFALIYGLSANPVHQGHIDLVTGALENLLLLRYDIAQTLIIPVYRRNPVGIRKDDLPGTYEQRVKMCELAVQEMQRAYHEIHVGVSQVEAHLAMTSSNPNYTAETLLHLKQEVLTDLDLIFLISSEIVSGENPEFNQWHRTDTILEVSSLAVCPRPGFPLNRNYLSTLKEKGGHFIVLEGVQTPDISSTTLRRRLQRGENPLSLAQEGLMPLSIAQYLNELNIYRNNNSYINKTKYYHENYT